MNLPPQITLLDHAGHSCLQLKTRHGSAVVALHGAHLLSWLPKGQHDLFWLSPLALPEPAAIRGGVPVCGPWFAKQAYSPARCSMARYAICRGKSAPFTAAATLKS